MIPTLSIGALARDTGAGVQAVRYYERRGLLTPVSRSATRYRRFALSDVQRVRFVKHAQTLGFTLDEIRDVLTLRIRNGGRCEAVRRAALSTRERVRVRLVSLQRMRSSLDALIRACERREDTDECPLLSALEPERVR